MSHDNDTREIPMGDYYVDEAPLTASAWEPPAHYFEADGVTLAPVYLPTAEERAALAEMTRLASHGFCVGNSHALIVGYDEDGAELCECGGRLALLEDGRYIHVTTALIGCPAYDCPCGQRHNDQTTRRTEY